MLITWLLNGRLYQQKHRLEIVKMVSTIYHFVSEVLFYNYFL